METIARVLGVQRNKGSEAERSSKETQELRRSQATSSKTGERLAVPNANSSKETDETAMPKERQEKQDCEFQWGSLKGMHRQAADRQAFTSLSCLIKATTAAPDLIEQKRQKKLREIEAEASASRQVLRETERQLKSIRLGKRKWLGMEQQALGRSLGGSQQACKDW